MTPAPDIFLSDWITSLAGHVDVIDHLMTLLACDFFMPVAMSLYLLYLWFGTRDPVTRVKNQYGAMCASASLGLANLGVQFFNMGIKFDPWDRPFEVHPSARDAAETVFYMPHDPSFPANVAAVTFGAAMGMFFYNRRASIVLFALGFALSFARVYAGVHYPLDIAGGAVIGVIMAYVSRFLLRFFWPLPTFCFWVARKLYVA